MSARLLSRVGCSFPRWLMYWLISNTPAKGRAFCCDPAIGVQIAVTMITCKRPYYLERTLSSFIEKNHNILGCLKIIILIQDDHDGRSGQVVYRYRNHICKAFFRKENLGVSGAFSTVMDYAIKENLPYILHLEDDFISEAPLDEYLADILDVFESCPRIGQVRLRSIKDKVSLGNMVTNRKIFYRPQQGRVVIGNAHFTYNPSLIRSTILNEILPVRSELEAMAKYEEMGLEAGQLVADCFVHIGKARISGWKEHSA